jgi:CSLREA domain-containing protein
MSLYRNGSRILLALFLAAAAIRPALGAGAVFVVTRTDDPAPDGCAVGDCSLREAIIAANATEAADTITLPGGTYALTRAGAAEDAASTGDLDITRDLTINASGPTSPIIDAGGLDRVIHARDASFTGITVAINGVVLQHGAVADSGGGVFVASAVTLRLHNSVVQANQSTGNDGGGGIYVQGSAELALTNSSVVNNVATSHNGGGIKNNNLLTVTNSTISGNTTVGQGGGIYNNSGTASLANATIANNEGSAGGLANAPGATLAIKNTLIATNHTGGQQPSDCGGAITSQGYNLIQIVGQFCTLGGSTAGNVINQSAQIGGLKPNGGPAPTHALLPGSPARNAGDPAGCRDGAGLLLAVDQRGSRRPGGSRCDIGAFEAQVVYLPAITR